MPQLFVTTRDGTEHAVTGAAGLSVMEVIRDNGFDDALDGLRVTIAPED